MNHNGQVTRSEVIEMPILLMRGEGGGGDEDDQNTNSSLSSRKQSWSKRQFQKVSSMFGDLKPPKPEAPRLTFRKSEIQRWRSWEAAASSGPPCGSHPDDRAGQESTEHLKITNPSVVNQMNLTQVRSTRSLIVEDSDGTLTDLPLNLGLLYPSLTSFKLTWSLVRCVPSSLLHSGLRVLDLEENQIQSIDKIESASCLERLILRNNQLQSLPEDIGSLSRLKVLDVAMNRLKDLPSSIGSLHSLERLDASQNKIKALPSLLGGLKKLKFLSVSHNQLADFPSTVSQLSSLEDLQASSNALSSLSYAFQSLTSLRSLLLSKNSFRSLPTCLSLLPRLENLSLSGNRLQLASEPLLAVRTLNVDNNLFAELPGSIVDSPNIEHLWMRGNQLTAVPERIVSMRNLRSLHLSNNPQLRDLPRAIIEMESLEHLFLLETGVGRCDSVVMEISARTAVHLDGEILGGQLRRPEAEWDEKRASSVTPEMLKMSRFCAFHSGGKNCRCNGRLHLGHEDEKDLKVVIDLDLDDEPPL